MFIKLIAFNKTTNQYYDDRALRVRMMSVGLAVFVDLVFWVRFEISELLKDCIFHFGDSFIYKWKIISARVISTSFSCIFHQDSFNHISSQADNPSHWGLCPQSLDKKYTPSATQRPRSHWHSTFEPPH